VCISINNLNDGHKTTDWPRSKRAERTGWWNSGKDVAKRGVLVRTSWHWEEEIQQIPLQLCRLILILIPASWLFEDQRTMNERKRVLTSLFTHFQSCMVTYNATGCHVAPVQPIALQRLDLLVTKLLSRDWKYLSIFWTAKKQLALRK